MYKGKKILAIIPARGGSKGLPGKNIRPLLGKPLIAWSIEHAQKSELVDEIFISTDSQEIADVAEQYGVKVPELRPAELASDSAPSSGFVAHTIEEFRKNNTYFDYILLLEPTSPTRKDGDIDAAIKLAVDNPDKDGVVSLGEVHMEHPAIVKTVTEHGVILPFVNTQKVTQRQQLGKVYFPYGVVYLIKVDAFMEKKIFYGENSLPLFIDRWQCYEVDDIYDFTAIEAIMKFQISSI